MKKADYRSEIKISDNFDPWRDGYDRREEFEKAP
jgi:hypothetical protein